MCTMNGFVLALWLLLRTYKLLCDASPKYKSQSLLSKLDFIVANTIAFCNRAEASLRTFVSTQYVAIISLELAPLNTQRVNACVHCFYTCIFLIFYGTPKTSSIFTTYIIITYSRRNWFKIQSMHCVAGNWSQQDKKKNDKIKSFLLRCLIDNDNDCKWFRMKSERCNWMCSNEAVVVGIDNLHSSHPINDKQQQTHTAWVARQNETCAFCCVETAQPSEPQMQTKVADAMQKQK